MNDPDELEIKRRAIQGELNDYISVTQILESPHRGKNVRIEPTAHVADDAVLGDDVYIGHGAIIASGVRIGARTRIWNYVLVLQNVTIGEDCMVASLCQIDPGSTLGDRTRVQPITAVNAFVGKDVFLGAGVVFTNHPYPPGKRLARVQIDDEVVVGSKVLFLPGVHIGRRAVVGSGAVVTKDVPPEVVTFGNPSTIRGTRAQFDAKRDVWEAGGEVQRGYKQKAGCPSCGCSLTACTCVDCPTCCPECKG